MTQPSDQEITDFVALQCARWNEHDKAGYLQAWQAIAPEGITFEDPVGTPPKTGWDTWSSMWDQFNASSLEQRIDYSSLRGNEIALLIFHKASYGGQVYETRDIEVWQFVDGMAHIRCWWNPPAGVDTARLDQYSNSGG